MSDDESKDIDMAELQNFMMMAYERDRDEKRRERKRSKNFSQRDTDILIGILEQTDGGRLLRAVSNPGGRKSDLAEKEKAWQEIYQLFLMKGGDPSYEVDTLKTKYKNLRNAVRTASIKDESLSEDQEQRKNNSGGISISISRKDLESINLGRSSQNKQIKDEERSRSPLGESLDFNYPPSPEQINISVPEDMANDAHDTLISALKRSKLQHSSGLDQLNYERAKLEVESLKMRKKIQKLEMRKLRLEVAKLEHDLCRDNIPLPDDSEEEELDDDSLEKSGGTNKSKK